jgi:glycoside/pentoside/hexuronide:cation symporter, GPH family
MENSAQKKLTLKEKISYGLGDVGNGFMFDMGQIFLMHLQIHQ